MSDDELVIRARNWDALCLYGWHPYMYNPQLKRWLRRIAVPTLVAVGRQRRRREAVRTAAPTAS